MDYKKEELTEYNGERGYWRTINGRKIFISIEDTKEETKEKIKNFVERKRSNNFQNAVQKNIDEANEEFDKKQNSARDRYKELRDKLQDKNLNEEQRDKIKDEMNALVLFHSSNEKQGERDYTKREIKEPKKKNLKEKTSEAEEDVLTRRTVTDPYIKFGEKLENEDLNDIETIKNKGEEYYYRNYAIERENKSFNSYTSHAQEEKRVEHNERLRRLQQGNEYLEDDKVKERKKHLAQYKDAEYMAKHYKKLKENVANYFYDKGVKYNDEQLMKNAEYLAERYLKERTKRWIIK